MNIEQTPLLQINNLTLGFGAEDSQPAIDNLNLTLNKGEVLGVVGETGSGKSLTALSVMQLLPGGAQMRSGEILFQPREQQRVNLTELDEKTLCTYRGRHLGMIFQEPMTSLNPVLRCGKQVEEALLIHGIASGKEAFERTLELFRLVELPRVEEIYKSYPHEISGGQKQRVMIAMAIACKPALLIADEPTTALDVTVQKRILELLRKLQRENQMGMIFITHDLGVVAEIADRVMVMYRGKVVEEGEVSSIFKNPQHPYTQGLLACRPPLNKRLKRLPTVQDFLQERDSGVMHEYIEITASERSQNQAVLQAKEPILRVEDLSKWYPRKKGIFQKAYAHFKAVDEVSFVVYPGETLGLVGESGCGKTTLGRTILKLIAPTAGKVIFKDQDLFELPREEMRKMRRELQIVFQDPYSSLNPRMPVGEAIAEPLIAHNLRTNSGERKEYVVSLLEKVGLKADHFNRYPHQFSGGQRQRVCIARALSVEPRFVICDESVSALDVSVQAQVLNLLNDLKREMGLTYIFISHDLSVVKFMSDRIMVMNKGKIEELGDADQVYENPQKEYTRRLIEAIPVGFQG